MSDKIEIPIDKVDLVLARKNAGMRNPSIEVDGDGQIIPRNSRNKDSSISSDYTVMVRSSTRAGSPEQSSRARLLKACKGLKGCEFLECSKKAFGKLPAHLQKLEEKCSVGNISEIEI